MVTIKFDESNNITEASTPKHKLKDIHSVITLRPPFVFFFAICSETILVAVKLSPDVERVIKNEYTDIINVKRPIPSVPIFLVIYELKYIDILCIRIEVRVNILIFIKNNFAFLK